jgi:deoxyhypusine synthase
VNVKDPHRRLDLSGAKTIRQADRSSKIDRELLVDAGTYEPGMARIERLMPSILAGRDIKSLADAWASALARGRAVILGMGGHPIKVGLSGLVIDLVNRGCLQAVAASGAAAIHDLEIAMAGRTSEDVAAGLADGTFGMTGETAHAYWEAVALAGREEYGFGQALGRYIAESKAPHRDLSVFRAAYERRVPATVHVTIGADVTHMHPAHDGAALGLAATRDFQVLAEAVKGLDDGGVYVNLGSAVSMPEVFLKAVNIVRNIDGRPKRIVTANLDMIQHYRPTQNVVLRPTASDGAGYQITGHHEIVFPLLYAMVRARLER